MSNFSAHLCEIVWRNHRYKSDHFVEFLKLLPSVYEVENGKRNLNYPANVFSSCMDIGVDDKMYLDCEDEFVKMQV